MNIFVPMYSCFNPFSPDGTLKCRFEKFLNFHLEGKGCPDTHERRDYEAVARYGTIVGQTQKSTKKKNNYSSERVRMLIFGFIGTLTNSPNVP